MARIDEANLRIKKRKHMMLADRSVSWSSAVKTQVPLAEPAY